jgi:hypothetical protein
LLGEINNLTVDSLGLVAAVLSDEGKYEEAEKAH